MCSMTHMPSGAMLFLGIAICPPSGNKQPLQVCAYLYRDVPCCYGTVACAATLCQSSGRLIKGMTTKSLFY